MSITATIKILHEAEGHVITCETVEGESFRGKLVEAEDSMNIQMSNVTVTHRDGSVSGMNSCFIRGSKVMFIAMPDNLRHAPVFTVTNNKASQDSYRRDQHLRNTSQVTKRRPNRGR